MKECEHNGSRKCEGGYGELEYSCNQEEVVKESQLVMQLVTQSC